MKLKKMVVCITKKDIRNFLKLQDKLNISDILSNIEFTMSNEDMQKLMQDLLAGYEDYIQNNPEADINKVGEQLLEYLQSKEVSELLNKKNSRDY